MLHMFAPTPETHTQTKEKSVNIQPARENGLRDVLKISILTWKCILWTNSLYAFEKQDRLHRYALCLVVY